MMVWTNGVLASNSATSWAGGIYLYNDGTVTLANVVVYGNNSTVGGGVYASPYEDVPPTITYTNAYGNVPENYDGMVDPTGVDGNISEDPQFLDISNPDPLYWDLHVPANSPLVDAGDPAIADPDGGTSDIGAYGGPNAEFWDLDLDGFYEWWLPGAFDAATSPGMDCDDRDAAVYPGNGC